MKSKWLRDGAFITLLVVAACAFRLVSLFFSEELQTFSQQILWIVLAYAVGFMHASKKISEEHEEELRKRDETDLDEMNKHHG